MELSEQIQDARQGNAAAQKYLFDRLSDPMMALCCRYVKNREDAEEILLPAKERAKRGLSYCGIILKIDV